QREVGRADELRLGTHVLEQRGLLRLRRRRLGLRLLAEALPPRQVDLGIHEVAVALDVAALAADDEDDRVLLARVRDPPRRRRSSVEQPTLAELARLAADVDADPSTVDEVELVL